MKFASALYGFLAGHQQASPGHAIRVAACKRHHAIRPSSTWC